MPEEMRFLLRSALYSLGVGGGYWFLTYEPVGTILLVGAGISAAAALGGVWFHLRRQGRRFDRIGWSWLLIPRPYEESHFTDERARLPGSSIAPISVGFGVSLAGLGLIFGPALIAASVIPIAIGLRSWLNGAMAEYSAIEREPPD